MPGKNAEPPVGLLYQSPHFLTHAQGSENIIEEGLEERAEFCDMRHLDMASTLPNSPQL